MDDLSRGIVVPSNLVLPQFPLAVSDDVAVAAVVAVILRIDIVG